MKKTKIVATLGPAVEDYEIKKKMAEAGVNVFRINFSHARHGKIKEQLEHIERIRRETGLHIAVLADLQGPKLRIGAVKPGVVLKSGDEFRLTTDDSTGDREHASVAYKTLPAEVKPGELILLDDGKIHLRVKSTDGKQNILTEVVQGGPLKSNKGLNLPDSKISVPSVTEKDKKDLDFAREAGVDWIALSFVRSAKDILELKAYLSWLGDDTPVIAKIEKPEAVQHLEEILDISDGVMVARGDLGIEIPMEQVPLIQKRIVRLAKRKAKPVIIATQMMESMMEQLLPSRAEVNDVANSVIDGADAVMLSGETSVGKHPLEVIERVSSIIRSVEEGVRFAGEKILPDKTDPRFITKTICFYAAETAMDIGAKAITTLTASGYSAAQVASHRPPAHILVFTHNKRILNRLMLYWGIYTFYYDKMVSTDETIRDIIAAIKKENFVETGDFAINLTSMPLTEKGMVNTLRITKIQ